MKKFLLLFMAVLTLVVTARAGDRFTVDNLSYTVISEENKTVIFNGAASGAEKPKGKFIIPQIVANGSTRYMVTQIDTYAFDGCEDLTSVTIPSTVTTLGIGNNLFSNCQNLSEIIVAEDNATFSSFNGMLFDKNKKTLLCCPRAKESVEIPNSVTEIGFSAFLGCSSLTSVTIPNSVIKIGMDAFSGCSGVTSVTIPNSVTEIGSTAFSRCSSLTSFTIPGSVTLVGAGALSNCSRLEEIIVAEYNSNYCSLDGVLYNKNQTTLRQVPGAKKSYEFPNSVTEIGMYAFSGCSGLNSVTIPNSVTKISTSAFRGCTGLTSVTIPNSVTIIPSDAFSGCSGLTSVTIPNSVTEIYSDAFSGCSGLTSVTIPNSVTKIGMDAFSGCSGLTSVTIPNSVTEIGMDAFSGCSGLTSIYCYAINPPALGSHVFNNVNISNVILHVVKGCETAYQEANTWKEFFIMADLNPQPESGIEGIMADGSDAPAEYYNLNGVRVNADNLTPGLYIKRQGGKATKVLVK